MDQERKKLLVFGYGLAVICAFVGIRLWVKHGPGPVQIIWLAAGLLFFVFSLFKVEWIKPFYRWWMQAAGVIGHCVTVGILCIIYYSLFSSVGLILRLLRKDLLDERLQPNRSSYWKKREEGEFNRERLKRQF